MTTDRVGRNNALVWVVVAIVIAVAGFGSLLLPTPADAETVTNPQAAVWEQCFLSVDQRDDIFDPLHVHFGRVANLSVHPRGLLRPIDDAPANFDNFGDNSTRHKYRDAGGTIWTLVPPTRAAYHQPDVDRWTKVNWLFREPPNRRLYPNRRILSQPDAQDRTFEIIITPDGDWIPGEGYQYFNQNVLYDAPYTSTFNYSTKPVAHYRKDVLPHERTWVNPDGATREGSHYSPAKGRNILRQGAAETPEQFQARVGKIATHLQLLKLARTKGTYHLERSSRTNNYRLKRLSDGRIIGVAPELTHAVDAHLRFQKTGCDRAEALSGTWTGTYTCSQGLADVNLKIDAKDDGQVRAELGFGPARNNPGTASGSASLRGTFNTKRMEIYTGLTRGAFSVTFGMVNADLGNGTMTGELQSDTNNCTKINLTKKHRGFQPFHNRTNRTPWYCSPDNPDSKEKLDELVGGIDENCDGVLNVDGDGDGSVAYECSTEQPNCNLPAGGDCDDINPAVKPGNQEIVSRTSNLDEDCSTVASIDGDGDGFVTYVCGHWVNTCNPPTDVDCDDTRNYVNPGKREIVSNTNNIDEDCSTTAEVDRDFDNYVAYECGHWVSSCNPPEPPDCDDSERRINPGAREIPNNGVDEDCDGHDPLACSSATESGGQGTYTHTYNLGPNDGRFYITYEMYAPLSDRIQVFIGDELRHDTGFVTGPGQLAFNYDYAHGASVVKVIVEGYDRDARTEWSYHVSCPGDPQPRVPYFPTVPGYG